MGLWVILFGIAYAAACMLFFKSMLEGVEKRRNDNLLEFSRWGAKEAIGREVASFHHLYASAQPVSEALKSAINDALVKKLACPALQPIDFKDIDRDLVHHETRTLLYSTSPRTLRGTDVGVLCYFSRTENVQGLRWWILVQGVRDPNKVFWFYLLSPGFMPGKIIPYWRREYDPSIGLKTVHPGFFNSLDVQTKVRELHSIVFETLVEVLDSFGLDTSMLKQQEASVLNVNVNGGHANIGSIVQGAFNKIQGVVNTGRKAA